MERRVEQLVLYLDALNQLKSVDYRCEKEIAECVDEIRKELISPVRDESKPATTAQDFIYDKHNEI